MITFPGKRGLLAFPGNGASAGRGRFDRPEDRRRLKRVDGLERSQPPGQVRPHETGSAAGLLNAVQQLGGTLGVALLGGLYLGTGTATAALGLAAGLTVAAAIAVTPMLSSRRVR